MKKCRAVMIFALSILLLWGATGCEKKNPHEDMIQKARNMVMDAWAAEYAAESYTDGSIITDGTVQIKNTRVIVLKDHEDKFSDYLENMSYIIEFTIFADYYGTAPYYTEIPIHNNVIVYKNGAMEVRDNILRAIFGVRYAFPTDHMAQVLDYGGEYNVTKICK